MNSLLGKGAGPFEHSPVRSSLVCLTIGLDADHPRDAASLHQLDPDKLTFNWQIVNSQDLELIAGKGHKPKYNGAERFVGHVVSGSASGYVCIYRFAGLSLTWDDSIGEETGASFPFSNQNLLKLVRWNKGQPVIIPVYCVSVDRMAFLRVASAATAVASGLANNKTPLEFDLNDLGWET